MDTRYYIIGDGNRKMVDMTKYKSQTAAFFDKLEEQSGSRQNRRNSTDSSDSAHDLDGRTFVKTEKKLPENSVVAINRERLNKISFSSLDHRPSVYSVNDLTRSLDYRPSKPYEASALTRPDPRKISRIPLLQSTDGQNSQPFAFSKGVISRHNKNNRNLLPDSHENHSYSPKFELKKRGVSETLNFEQKPQSRFDFNNDENFIDGSDHRASKLSMIKQQQTRQSGFDKFEMTLYLSDQDALCDEFICVNCRKKLLLSKYYIHKAVCSNYNKG